MGVLSCSPTGEEATKAQSPISEEAGGGKLSEMCCQNNPVRDVFRC